MHEKDRYVGMVQQRQNNDLDIAGKITVFNETADKEFDRLEGINCFKLCKNWDLPYKFKFVK